MLLSITPYSFSDQSDSGFCELLPGTQRSIPDWRRVFVNIPTGLAAAWFRNIRSGRLRLDVLLNWVGDAGAPAMHCPKHISSGCALAIHGSTYEISAHSVTLLLA